MKVSTMRFLQVWLQWWVIVGAWAVLTHVPEQAERLSVYVAQRDWLAAQLRASWSPVSGEWCRWRDRPARQCPQRLALYTSVPSDNTQRDIIKGLISVVNVFFSHCLMSE